MEENGSETAMTKAHRTTEKRRKLPGIKRGKLDPEFDR